jgi:hypothetical protein
MIVMGSFRGGFISSFSVSKFPLGGKSETGEKLQSAVNSCVADLRIGFGDEGIYLGKAFMAGRIQKNV